ncbi:DEAD/DEAH box helicase [Blautia sp.]
MLGSKKYISDIIKDEYKEWKNTKVIVSSGTGTGKTQFMLRVLLPYYLQAGKRVLYLCNRKVLYDQIRKEMLSLIGVTLMTYQSLQKELRKGSTNTYDLVIADECHYFYLDAKFNGYTDLAYEYVMGQQANVVVFVSATADSFFEDLVKDGVVKKDHIYSIPKSYDYVEKVYTYHKSMLTDIIDEILADTDFEKILVFVNSMERLIEMHNYYGDSAYYMCSQSQACSFATRDCIENKKFSNKRMLFTTKVMDNGVDIIDDDLRHIITELFDIDSILQSIGRKRPIDYLDTCSFYFKIYDGRAVNNFYVSNQKQLEPVERYIEDKDKFLQNLDTQNLDARQIARKNKIFYTDFRTGTLKVNQCTLKKYQMDRNTIKDMKQNGYETVLFRRLGTELLNKKSELRIETDSKDIFLSILKELEGKKLFKEEQEELKEKFRDILGLHDRTMGINTLNGKLQDRQYQYKIVSCKDRSRQSETYNKRYWMIQKI